MRFFVVDEPLVFHLLWNKTFLQAGKLLAVKCRLIWDRYTIFERLALPRCWECLHASIVNHKKESSTVWTNDCTFRPAVNKRSGDVLTARDDVFHVTSDSLRDDLKSSAPRSWGNTLRENARPPNLTIPSTQEYEATTK